MCEASENPFLFRLFRNVIAEASRELDVPVTGVKQRELLALAATKITARSPRSAARHASE